MPAMASKTKETNSKSNITLSNRISLRSRPEYTAIARSCEQPDSFVLMHMDTRFDELHIPATNMGATIDGTY